jgi:2-methylcitrate dehydratase
VKAPSQLIDAPAPGRDDAQSSSGFARRELMKIGAAAVASVPMLAGSPLFAQQAAQQPTAAGANPVQPQSNNPAVAVSEHEGWDEPSRRLVDYVASFSEANLSDRVAEAAGYTLLDTMAALVAGFEAEPVRIGARMARQMSSDLKSTVMGYGITTSPEMATFANGCMLRCAEFNDVNTGGHFSDTISAILAVGEAFHASGAQVLAAVVLSYELTGAMTNAGARARGWDSPFQLPAMALATGKLMGLNREQLASALSLALVSHMPMSVAHKGPLSMWKSCHAGETARCAVFSALLARAGMTAPPQPFAAEGGLFFHIGAFKDLRLPANGPDGRMVIETTNYKRYPSEASTQSVIELIPEIRAWTKPEDIASILIELPPGWVKEVADPSKWDLHNRETADHSMPYVIARGLLDGEIYLDSFSDANINDPAARQLMALMTARANSNETYQNEALSLSGQVRLTVRNKSGGELVKETTIGYKRPLTHEEIVAKFDRVCAFRQVSDAQRAQARTQWLNLRAIRDIAEPINTLATFGKPLPL